MSQVEFSARNRWEAIKHKKSIHTLKIFPLKYLSCPSNKSELKRLQKGIFKNNYETETYSRPSFNICAFQNLNRPAQSNIFSIKFWGTTRITYLNKSESN